MTNKVEYYKKVLKGEEKRFKFGFWTDKKVHDYAPKITRYLIEEVLQWNEEDIKTKFKSSTLEKYKLAGMFKHVYRKNVYMVIDAAYPGKFQPWELSSTPNKFWRDKEHCVLATRWLIEEKLGWDDERVKEELTGFVFMENGFSGLLKWGWNGSIYDALESTYPGKFKPWELRCVPTEYWNEKSGTEALKWFVEHKMKWTEEEILMNWRTRTLKKHGFMKVVTGAFDNNMFSAINAIYPNKFKPSDFPQKNIHN